MASQTWADMGTDRLTQTWGTDMGTDRLTKNIIAIFSFLS